MFFYKAVKKSCSRLTLRDRQKTKSLKKYASLCCVYHDDVLLTKCRKRAFGDYGQNIYIFLVKIKSILFFVEHFEKLYDFNTRHKFSVFFLI